ncbi:hypothetical protein ACWT_3496 [Actinoplanes sp. SE50]|nr:hypothetical protein ACWT_3496 [Actinoplanes sp. SE50]
MAVPDHAVMAATDPSATARPVVRVLLWTVLTIAVAVLAALAGALLTSFAAPASRLAVALLRYDASGVRAASDAWLAAPDGSVRLDVTVTPGRVGGGSRYFDVDATFTFPGADHPVVSLLRSGADQQQIPALLGSAAVRFTYTAHWEDPVVTVRPGAATVRLHGSVLVPVRDRTTMAVPATMFCGKFRSRTVVVNTGRLVPRRLTAEPAGGDCPTGAWDEQTAGSVTFHGLGGAHLDLEQPSGPADAAGTRPRPLFGLPRQITVALRNLWFGLLLLLPILMMWRSMRGRAWPGELPARVVHVFGSMTAFGVLACAGSATQSVVSEMLFHWSLTGHPWPTSLYAPYELVPLAMVACTAVLWRSLALWPVLTVRHPRARRFWAMIFVAFVVLAVPASAMLTAGASPQSEAVTVPATRPAAIGGVPPVAEPSPLHWLTGTAAGYAITLLLVCLLLVTASAALAWSIRACGHTVRTAAATAAVLLALLYLTPFGSRIDTVSTVVQGAVSIAAGVAVWTAFERILRHAVTADPPSWWLGLHARLRPWRSLRLLAAVALSVPVVVYGDEGPRFSFYDTLSLSVSIAGTLRAVAVLLLVLLMWHFGRAVPDGGTAVGTRGQLRAVAALLAVTGLLSPTATTAGLPLAFAFGLLAIHRWLLPPRPVPDLSPPVGPDQEFVARAEVGELTRTAVRARVTESLVRDLRRAVADGHPDAAVQDARAERVADLAGAPCRSATVVWSALSSYRGLTPWRLALTLGLLATLVGLPWSLIDLSTVLATLSSGGPFRLVDAAGGILVVARFTIAGLVLGIAYPMVRGRTGLGKGLSLFVTMTVPALIITLLPDPTRASALAAAGLQTLQWLAFGLVMGLATDLLTLRRFGYGWAHLRELHRMNVLTASVSTMLVSVVTATVTAVGTGAAAVFVQRVLPPPPAATQPQTSGNTP